MPRVGRVHRVDLGFRVAPRGGQRRRAGFVCTSSPSLSGDDLWVRSGELGAVDSCHPSWVVRIGFARLSFAAASFFFWAAGGEAVAASAAADFVPELFLRVVRWCSVVGDEFFGSLYRRCSKSLLAGGNGSGARCVVVGEGGGRFPMESAAAQLRGVRGSSPADAAQLLSSRRPCARRVSLEVLQFMVLARSCGCGWFVFFIPDWCWFSGGGDGLVRRPVWCAFLPFLLSLCLSSEFGQSSALGKMLLYCSMF